MAEQQNASVELEPGVEKQSAMMIRQETAQSANDADNPGAEQVMRVTLAHAQVTPPQATALAALTKGMNLNEAAAAANVDRATLYRWRHMDRNFIAVLNAWREDQQAAARDTLLSLSQEALSAVAGGLKEGNASLGLRVLDRLGSAQIGPTQPTFPREIFGPGITDDDADRLWEDLKDAIMNMPEIKRPGAARIIKDAMAAEAKWGPDLLEGLARSRQSRRLDAEQSARAGAMIMVQIRTEEAIRAAAGEGAL